MLGNVLSEDARWWVTIAVATVFAIGTVVNLIGPGPIRDGYARWHYPFWFRFVTAGCEAVALVMILVPATRVAGLVLGALVMLAAVITLVVAREAKHAPPAIIVLLLCVLLI